MTIKRRDWLIAACALAASRGHAQGLWRAEDLDWRDDARSRAVPVRLYWPVDAPGPHPVLLFSHGIGGSRRGYSYLGQHLAAQGVVSLHVQHVGSDRALWGGNVFEMLGRLQQAARREEALARVQDTRFALDRLLAEHAPQVDAARIAIAGHSYGANTSLLLAGAAIPGEPLLRDERLRAAVFISAPPLHGVEGAEQALAAIRIPTLHITATEDVIRIPGYRSDADDRIALYAATGSAAKALAVFKGGSHSVFTDRAGTGGAIDNPRIKAATKELVASFVRAVFDEAPLAERLALWHAAHAGMLAQWRGG